MAFFKTREPRKFNHPYMYVNERKDKLKAIEERAKRELGMAPPKEFNPEDIRGTFVKGTKHLRRRKESGRGADHHRRPHLHLALSAHGGTAFLSILEKRNE